MKHLENKTKDMAKYFVQETIGGWKQTPCFEGTYEECIQYLNNYCNDSRSSFTIVGENELQVDYL